MENISNPSVKFLDPQAIIAQLDVKKGDVVADFGCGPGYFSLPFAQAVGEEGKVYSLDVLPQALEAVVSKARLAGISNISTKHVNLESEGGSKLIADSFDWVILKDVLFQNKNKEVILKEAYRVLKDDGKVIAIEWNGQDSSVGPDLELRILPQNLKAMFEKQKLFMEKDIDAGNFHYAFVAKKQKSNL